MKFVRAIDAYYDQDDEFMHPLWIGILLLFSVIIIVGISCYLRIKCRSQFHGLRVRLSVRNTKKNEHHSSDEKSSVTNHSSNWPSASNPARTQSPKLYALVKNLRTAQLDRQTSLKQKISQESGQKPDQTQRPILPSSSGASDHDRASEIARKFYASMRSVGQGRNSSSDDSYGAEALSGFNTPVSAADLSLNASREENFRLFSTPCFFQSIPNTSLA